MEVKGGDVGGGGGCEIVFGEWLVPALLYPFFPATTLPFFLHWGGGEWGEDGDAGVLYDAPFLPHSKNRRFWSHL